MFKLRKQWLTEPDGVLGRFGSKRGALARRLTLLTLVLTGVGIFLVMQMPKRIQAMEEQRKYDSEYYQFAELFTEIFGQIKQRYVTDVDSKALFEGAINGMFNALDPHSSWLPPQAEEMLTKDTEGEYSGVGMHITMRDGILTVISPIEGSPAAKAGVLPWDRVIEIGSKTTQNMTLLEAVSKLTGPNGTQIKIKVWRAGKQLEFTLTRQKIKVDSVFSRELEDQIGYMRISKFQEDTAEAVKKVLKQFNKDGMRGIIVDVRFDPGGLLDRAVEVCNCFLPKGQIIVSTKGRISSSNREYYAMDDPIWPADKPMVVLLNEYSASASEIFSGAMKDTKRAVIIGPKGGHSYGKGSVQTISLLKHSLERDPNGDIKPSGLRLTTAKYYTPGGHPIEVDKGVKPDIGVELPANDTVELLRHGMLGDPAIDEPGHEIDVDDTTSTDTQQTTGTTNTGKKAKPAAEIIPPSGTEDDDQATSISLDERLRRLQAKQNSNGKPAAAPKKKGEFHDTMLDEAVKYMKAIMIFESRKAA